MKTKYNFWAALIELASLLSGCATLMVPDGNTGGEASIFPENWVEAW